MTSECSPSSPADAGSSGRTPALLYANSGSTSVYHDLQHHRRQKRCVQRFSPVSLFMCKPHAPVERAHALRATYLELEECRGAAGPTGEVTGLWGTLEAFRAAWTWTGRKRR